MFHMLFCLSHSQVGALQRAGPAAVAVPLGAEGLGVAALAVDVAVGRVAAQHRVQRPRAAPAREAFLVSGNTFTVPLNLN